MNDIPPKFSWQHAFTDTDLGATTKYVLLIIGLFMNTRGGGCFPSIETIAETGSLGISTVNKHITLAVKAGWITKSKHGFGDERWARNEYNVCYPENIDPEQTENATKTVVHQVDDSSENGSLPGSKGSSTSCKMVGHQVDTNISLNKPINKKRPQSPDLDEDQKSEFEKQFEQIWNKWHNRQDKFQALAAYQMARAKASHAWIAAGAAHYEKNRVKNDQSGKLLKNWLGAQGWLDVTEPIAQEPTTASVGDENLSGAMFTRWAATMNGLDRWQGQGTARTWFTGIRLVEGDNQDLTVVMGRRFTIEKIKNNLLSTLQDSFAGLGGGKLSIVHEDDFDQQANL